eukprot:TRINITY_DN75768_c0_g1_i1.p1 TRINITY_DN75768_c0_g1~~TRINITY_DN75768_c0_g1_i1.p1  ORF type:complete len:550 (+),score=83.74 TRINITY_DN75768_c0_g1_i1:59-1708(+)
MAISLPPLIGVGGRISKKRKAATDGISARPFAKARRLSSTKPQQTKKVAVVEKKGVRYVSRTAGSRRARCLDGKVGRDELSRGGGNRRGLRGSVLATILQGPLGEEDVMGRPPLDFFNYYVYQVSLKHGGPKARRLALRQGGLHPFVRDHGFPPAGISEEINLKWVQKYLRKRMSGGDKAMEVILMGAFQAPDQPFCFKEVLPYFLKGVNGHRREGYQRLLKHGASSRHATSADFEALQRTLERRYTRGIDPAKLASGERKGNVYGYGDVGIYNAEHQTSIMPGMTHPEGLRWKLEHWPLWLERVVLPRILEWPNSDDPIAIATMLRERYPRQLPHGIETEIIVSPPPDSRRRRIVDLFGGDAAYAHSALSQALLFADFLKPVLKEDQKLRKHALGAGPFTVRGFWMAYHRDRKFPALDTRTFCPGFVGALKGAEAVQVRKATGVWLSVAPKGSIMWASWETQVRFGAWLYTLQQHAERARTCDADFASALAAAGVKPPMHCSDVEACLCFMSRLVTMFTEERSSATWQAASRGIGDNMPKSLLKRLFQ